MRKRMLSKRANKRNFAHTAGYINKKNAGGNFLMRGGQRL